MLAVFPRSQTTNLSRVSALRSQAAPLGPLLSRYLSVGTRRGSPPPRCPLLSAAPGRSERVAVPRRVPRGAGRANAAPVHVGEGAECPPCGAPRCFLKVPAPSQPPDATSSPFSPPCSAADPKRGGSPCAPRGETLPGAGLVELLGKGRSGGKARRQRQVRNRPRASRKRRVRPRWFM